MLISICIATYKRPQRLRLLLEGIDRLSFTRIERPEIEAIVVENDTSGSARKICQELAEQFQWSIKTGVEAERGITYARNKTISMVSEAASFIAIIDDDEIPEPTWLEELLLAQQKYQAEIVTGPVLPSFAPEVPDWIVEGRFFAPPRFPTGKLRPVAYTNNVLVEAEILRNIHPAFDNRFATSGGSDCYLFLSLHKAGYKIVWTDEAIVYDNIPASRTNFKWLWLRGYREPSSYSAAEKELYPSFWIQLVRMLKGFALIAIGFLKIIPSLLISHTALVKASISIARGFGTLGGLIGLFYEEYKHIVCTTPSETKEYIKPAK